MREENCYVAFIDVLGFSDLVSNENESKLSSFFNVCEAMIAYWEKIESKRSFEVYNFSDSIVVLAPYPEEAITQLELFNQFCIALAELQYKLALNNIWIRGGVSFGKMKIKKRGEAGQKLLQLYGDPLIKAYKIESKIAKFPRIVIDPNIIEFLGLNQAQELIVKMNNNNFDN